MAPRIQITARNIKLNPRLRSEITKKAEKLNEFYGRITRCRIVIEVPHRHHREGILYNVRIDLTVPGKEVAIEREPNQDLRAAIRDAFDAAYRRIEEYAQIIRGEVKTRVEG